MMRWLFLILVVVNGCFVSYVWQHDLSQKRDVQTER